MNRFSLFILFTLLLYCCNSPKDKITGTILYNDSVGYWNYEWPRERSEFYGMTFEFKSNGKLRQYSFSKTENKRLLFSDYGIVPRLEWGVANDSIFTLMNYNSKIKIVKYNKDTIWLFDQEQNRSSMLIRVKGNLNIEK
ncbi:hypothetical protein FO675_08000 [Riemerella anatipestifer]|uniref:hypothetical protein n=1 Tax=Riemerella anatipestifer TaxID=34085 RepID=UPI001AD73C57|nr:hypothetical protein [Riemerella anatipestifer]MBO4234232.1 hypothetical protein [Riemerella anatipestifer]